MYTDKLQNKQTDYIVDQTANKIGIVPFAKPLNDKDTLSRLTAGIHYSVNSSSAHPL